MCNPRFAGVIGEILEDWTGPGRGEGAWVRPGASRGGPGRALGESWERPGAPGRPILLGKTQRTRRLCKKTLTA